MGLPFWGWLALLAWQHQVITGDWTYSPHELYYDLYSPRHRFGFYQADSSRQTTFAVKLLDGEKAFQDYNAWSDNHTPARALQNAWTRGYEAGRWAVGFLLVFWSAVWRLLQPRQLQRGEWLMLGAVVGLHVAYLPYFAVGIHGFSYVFETVPVGTYLVACAVGRVSRALRDAGRPTLARLIIGYVVVMVSLQVLPWHWWRPDWRNLTWGHWQNVALFRTSQRAFKPHLRDAGVAGPALVFVDRGDVPFQQTLVVNEPDLSNPVLLAHDRGAANVLLARSFPGHQPWICRLKAEPNGVGIELREIRPLRPDELQVPGFE